MQAGLDELVHMRFTGKMVKLFLEIDKEMYKSCMTQEAISQVALALPTKLSMAHK